ncbi:MAG TPA: hypothetical protein EYO61_04695 [Campylobacterales bacterium]|nr:hypothetical protein [Campylobacterales bacterium]HIO71352.1 hypothetical protein [Campylobacterales bacterium]
MKKIFSILFISLLSVGCGGKVATGSNTSQHSSSEKPFWVDNPASHPAIQGKIFALGSAVENIRGEEAQKLKAISIAIDKIARQKGVIVKSSLSRTKHVQGASQSSSINSFSVQMVDGSKVSTRIVDSWKDPRTKKFYVLMVEDR